jgi:DNA-directed RNA polymerase specialized sigma24 family protein
MQALVEPLRDQPGIVAQLPLEERAMIQLALDGRSVYEIAQQSGVSEGAVWDLLQRVTQLALGRIQPRTEVGGLGSE